MNNGVKDRRIFISALMVLPVVGILLVCAWFFNFRSEEFYERHLSAQGDIIGREKTFYGYLCFLRHRAGRTVKKCHDNIKEYLVVEFSDQQGNKHIATTQNAVKTRGRYDYRPLNPVSGEHLYLKAVIAYDPNNPDIISVDGGNLYSQLIGCTLGLAVTLLIFSIGTLLVFLFRWMLMRKQKYSA